MPDYAVIYDPALEVSAIIDTDAGQAVGPIYPGPNGQAALEAFLNDTPPAFLENSTPEVLTEAFRQFWAKNYGGAAAVQPADQPAVEPGLSPAGDAGSALAEATAVSTADVPAPQPADTDMAASAGAPATVSATPLPDETSTPTPSVSDGTVTPPADTGTPLPDASTVPAVPVATQPCPFCNATGTIHIGGDTPDQTCTACAGTGKIPAPVTA